MALKNQQKSITSEELQEWLAISEGIVPSQAIPIYDSQNRELNFIECAKANFSRVVRVLIELKEAVK